MEATVELIDCPRCGSDDLRGIQYAYCNDCGWHDYEAASAAHDHHEAITIGAI